MNVLDGFAQYLADNLIATYTPSAAGGQIYLEDLPQTPDLVIGLYVTGGPASDPKLGYDSPVLNVQIRGDAADLPGARALAWDIYGALHGLHSVTLGDGTRVIDCRGVQSGPVSLPRDENDRPRYSLNFQTEIRNVTAHRE